MKKTILHIISSIILSIFIIFSSGIVLTEHTCLSCNNKDIHLLSVKEKCCTSHHESHKTKTYNISNSHNKSDKQICPVHNKCCKYKTLIYRISKPFISKKHIIVNHIIPLITVLITNESQEKSKILRSFFDTVIHFKQISNYLSFINVWIL